MGWTLNSTRVIVTGIVQSQKQIIARLQPLSGGTIIQTFGYDDPIIKIKGYVVGETDKSALEALTTTGSTYTLMEDSTNHGSFYVNSIDFNRLNTICQTIRPDLDTTATVYEVDLELYE